MHTMKAISDPRLDLEQFLELVLMWHCAGDIPMDRIRTSEFIEDDAFLSFLNSVALWCDELGLEHPSHSQIVRTLHQLYEEEAV